MYHAHATNTPTSSLVNGIRCAMARHLVSFNTLVELLGFRDYSEFCIVWPWSEFPGSFVLGKNVSFNALQNYKCSLNFFILSRYDHKVQYISLTHFGIGQHKAFYFKWIAIFLEGLQLWHTPSIFGWQIELRSVRYSKFGILFYNVALFEPPPQHYPWSLCCVPGSAWCCLFTSVDIYGKIVPKPCPQVSRSCMF